MHHEAAEMAREVVGGACPQDLLHAQEYPVLNGLPPIGEGAILGPGLLGLDEPKSEHAIQRNSLDSMDNAFNQRVDSACSMSGTALSWATPRMTAFVFAHETLQPSTNRRGVVGVAGPAAQLAQRQPGGEVHLVHGLHNEIRQRRSPSRNPL